MTQIKSRNFETCDIMCNVRINTNNVNKFETFISFNNVNINVNKINDSYLYGTMYFASSRICRHYITNSNDNLKSFGVMISL